MSDTSFSIPGRDSGIRIPFFAGYIDVAQGPTVSPTGQKSALYMVPIPASGGPTAVANKYYDVTSFKEVDEYLLDGTPGNRAIKAHLSVHQKGRVKFIGYPETTGAGVTKSSMTITLGGTLPPVGSIIEIKFLTEVIQMSVATGDTFTTLTSQLATKVNTARSFMSGALLPFTANPSAAITTLQSRIAGASQNNVYPVEVVRIPPGMTITLSSSSLVGGVDGATTELAGIQAAIATMGASTNYFHALTNQVSAHFSALKSFVFEQSDGDPGLRCWGIQATRDTKSAAAAIALAQNYERSQYVWHYASPHDPAEIVAQMMAIRQKYEAVEPHFSFANYMKPDWVLQSAPESLWPTDLNAALSDGLTAIGNAPNGRTFVTLSSTTRSKDQTGTKNDFRAADTHRIVVFDDLVDEIISLCAKRYEGFRLMPDKLNADGTVDVNQRIPAKTTTPSQVQRFVLDVILSHGPDRGDGRLIEMDEWEESLAVRIDPQNRSRCQAKFGGKTANLATQFTFRGAETSVG